MPEIGKALKRAVEIKPQEGVEDRSRKRSASALMNANRRKIFQFLCLHPCSRIDAISSSSSLSRTAAKWHLDRLIEAGYVQTYLDSKKMAYYPSGLISTKNLQVYSVLGRKSCMSIYQAILQSPGSNIKSFAGDMGISTSTITGCLKDLIETGLITRVIDGRFARYFPTEKYLNILREEKVIRKDFIRLLVRKMADEHLKPELRDLKGPNIIIQIQVLGKKDVIEIST